MDFPPIFQPRAEIVAVGGRGRGRGGGRGGRGGRGRGGRGGRGRGAGRVAVDVVPNVVVGDNVIGGEGGGRGRGRGRGEVVVEVKGEAMSMVRSMVYWFRMW